MKSAFLRFYEELNDFLPKEKKKTSFSCTFSGNPSVKDLIESRGVPHVVAENRSPLAIKSTIKIIFQFTLYLKAST
jgi:hypothetical protein